MVVRLSRWSRLHWVKCEFEQAYGQFVHIHQLTSWYRRHPGLENMFLFKCFDMSTFRSIVQFCHFIVCWEHTLWEIKYINWYEEFIFSCLSYILFCNQINAESVFCWHTLEIVNKPFKWLLVITLNFKMKSVHIRIADRLVWYNRRIRHCYYVLSGFTIELLPWFN